MINIDIDVENIDHDIDNIDIKNIDHDEKFNSMIMMINLLLLHQE